MSRRLLAVLLCVSLLGLPGLAADRDASSKDASSKDVRGIPHGHKHLWAVIGGTAVGLGLGAIPGGTKNVFKGGLIGGSAASLFYLAGHRGQEGPWSYVLTNAALVAGIGWAACDCGAGFGAGALVGGGGTALFQAFKPRNRTLGKITGTAPDTTAQAPPPQQQYPPAQNPSALPQSDNPQVQPQATPPQSVPPTQPQTAPPAPTVPPTEQPAPQAPPQTVPPGEPQTTPQTPPPQGQQSNPPHATLLPDAPEPKGH
jgi:hypothetical protein